jgi:hypothetical protein
VITRFGSAGSSRTKSETLSVSQPPSGFAQALSALREADVDFVPVGVAGIDFYGRTPGQVFATLDLHRLLPPGVENLSTSPGILLALGCVFEAEGEPFLNLEDTDILARVVANGACLSAIHAEEGHIDLMTSLAGFTDADLNDDATAFRVARVEVRAGQLEKLIRSKQRSGARRISSSCGHSRRAPRKTLRTDGRSEVARWGSLEPTRGPSSQLLPEYNSWPCPSPLASWSA